MIKGIILEAKHFYSIIWDQMLLSIIFAVIIYGTYEDYNFKVIENEPFVNKAMNCLHFSIVTQYTVGYGYVVPQNKRGQIINIIHMIISYYLLAKDAIEKIK